MDPKIESSTAKDVNNKIVNTHPPPPSIPGTSEDLSIHELITNSIKRCIVSFTELIS